MRKGNTSALIAVKPKVARCPRRTTPPTEATAMCDERELNLWREAALRGQKFIAALRDQRATPAQIEAERKWVEALFEAQKRGSTT
jgi:hypothetical protein